MTVLVYRRYVNDSEKNIQEILLRFYQTLTERGIDGRGLVVRGKCNQWICCRSSIFFLSRPTFTCLNERQ